MDDAARAIERGKRRRGPALELKLAEIVILDHPRLASGGPVEQARTPRQRQCGSEWRLLSGRHDNQRRVGSMFHAVIDIDAVSVDRDRRDRQSCKRETVPREGKARFSTQTFVFGWGRGHGAPIRGRR